MLGTLANPGYSHKNLEPPMAKFRSHMHYRAVVRESQVRFYGNGRLLRTVELPEDHDPWVAFGRIVKNTIRIWNVRITGKPVIPDEIRLSASQDLTGWITFYGESIGGSPAERRRWRQDGDQGDRGIISGSRNTPLDITSNQESLAYYHRPMLEDGTIEYEFRYEKDLWHTHPALGRTVFLLQPDGVRVHRLTNGIFDRSDIDPGNTIVEPENRRGPAELPLRTDEWNFVQLKVTGDTVNLYLNDKHIYQRKIESHNQRNFGLFHYSGRSRVYARNVVWRGDWPKKLPPISAQELLGHETDFLDDALPRLTAKFSHTFTDDHLPADLFSAPYTEPSDVVPGPDGVVVKKSSSDSYEKSIVEAALGVSGDFDIRARFDNFKTDLDTDGGNGNVYLQLALNDDMATKLNMRRRHSLYEDRDEESHRVYADYAQRRTKETRRDGIGQLSSEAESGTLRIARRGSVAYMLWAEGDSDDFHIVSTQEVGTDDVKVGGVRLRLLTYRKSSMSVRFKTLDVHAEKLLGPAADGPLSQELVQEINTKRDNLPAEAVYDFAKQAFPDDFWPRGDIAEWSPEAGGLVVRHAGQEPWGASSVTLRPSVQGDFDLTFTFELTDVINPNAGKESWIYMKAYLMDENVHQRTRGTDHNSTGAS